MQPAVMQMAPPMEPGPMPGGWWQGGMDMDGPGQYGDGPYEPGPSVALQRGPSVALAPGVEIQADALRTWSYEDPRVERVQVDLSTVGGPLSATVEVWQEDGNTPIQTRVWSEDGAIRPFSAVMDTSRHPTKLAVRNIGPVEVPPISAQVDDEYVELPQIAEHQDFSQIIEGGVVQMFPMDPNIEAVEVLLETNGAPLNARIEILQPGGSEDLKQVIELYTEDGLERPFFCTLGTPFGETDVRIVNTGPVEFPMTASVVPTAPRGTVPVPAVRD